MAKRNYVSLATVSEYELPIKVFKEGNYLVAKSPVWPDCYAQGETIEEAISEVVAVAGSLIELYKEEGLSVPLQKAARRRIIQPQTVVKVPVFVSV